MCCYRIVVSLVLCMQSLGPVISTILVPTVVMAAPIDSDALEHVGARETGETKPTDASERDRLHKEGVQLFREGKIEDAEQAFRKVLEQDGRYTPARYDLAALLIAQGRLREGLAHYEFIALKLLPEDVTARYRYGLALHQARRTSAAVDQLGKALEFDPQRQEVRRDLVKILLAGKELMKASSVSATGVQLHPNDASVHNDYGVVLMQLGKPPAAVESFRRAVELDANHPDAHYNMGLALNEQWKLDEAAEQLQAALNLRPEYTDAHYNLGKVFARQGNAAAARQSLQKVVDLQPNYYVAHHELGMVALREEDFRKAIQHFTEALRHQPGFHKSQYHLGLAMMKLGRPKLAIPQFEGVLRRSPEHADARYQMGLALAQTGKTELARAQLREAAWLRPGWTEADSALNTLSESQSPSPASPSP